MRLPVSCPVECHGSVGYKLGAFYLNRADCLWVGWSNGIFSPFQIIMQKKITTGNFNTHWILGLLLNIFLDVTIALLVFFFFLKTRP